MELNTAMSASEKAQVENAVNTFNAKNNAVIGRQTSQSLGKDDFFFFLITQLSNQDPTNPVEDTQFIAQMAQFSSLEQMANMNQQFTKMTAMLNSSEAMSVLGKTVELNVGDTTTTGVVEGITRGENPQIKVNGAFYDMERINAVYGE